MSSYALPPPPSFGSKDYISSIATFQSDSIPLRLDYERFFLDHKKALSQAKKTMDTTNEEVFGQNGLRARLAANHKVNPPRETRAMEIARDNSKLVERLTEISFKSHSATTNQIVERNKRVVSRLPTGGSLNDHIRQQERERIEEQNMGLAARLLSNKSEYAPENFRAHIQQHQYLVKNKSRLRAIQMKTSTPGQYLNRTRTRSLSPRATTADHPHRNREAETQAADEYAGALRSYTSQQTSLGYGLPIGLPPIPGSSDVELLGVQEPWLEQHQSDLQRLKQLNTHAPKVRQSLGINPREALHTPFSKHYHHQGFKNTDFLRAQQLQQAFQTLDTELVVPRTRLDPETGAYETVWIELRHARPDETHLAQRRPDMKAADLAAEKKAEQAAQAQAQAMAQWSQQQQAMAMYAAYVAHTNAQAAAAGRNQQADEAGKAADQEAKEAQPPSGTDASTDAAVPPLPFGFFPAPPDSGRIIPDGSPFAAPIWPFGGEILPPHLLPPSEPLPKAKKPAGARRSESTKRGLQRRMLFPIRKNPHDAPPGSSPGKSARKDGSKSARDSSSRKDGTLIQRWQSHAQHVENVEKFRETIAGGSPKRKSAAALGQEGKEEEEQGGNSPSKAASVPTIAGMLSSSGKHTKDSDFPNTADAFISGSAPHGIKQYSSTETHIPGARGVPLPAFKGEFEPAGFMAGIHSDAGKEATPRKKEEAQKKTQARGSNQAKSTSSSSSSSAAKPPARTPTKPPISAPPPATVSASSSSVSLRPVSRPSSGSRSSATDEKRPLVPEDSSVLEKVEAFELVAAGLRDRDTPEPEPQDGQQRRSRAGSNALEPTPPVVPVSSSSDARSRRQSHSSALSASSSQSSLALPSQSPGMLQLAPGQAKRSSLRDIPLSVVSPAVAERAAARRSTFEARDAQRMKEELERKAALASQAAEAKEQQQQQEEKEAPPVHAPAPIPSVVVAPASPEFVPTSKYSNSHPLSIAHSSPSTSNLQATTAPAPGANVSVASSRSTSQIEPTPADAPAAKTVEQDLDLDIGDADIGAGLDASPVVAPVAAPQPQKKANAQAPVAAEPKDDLNFELPDELEEI